MDMSEIKKRAQEESFCNEGKILYWLQAERNALISKRMEARDIVVPVGYLLLVEKIADKVEIPLYFVCNRTFSIALTYCDLLQHERER